MLQYLHVLLKLAVNSVVNRVSNVAANMKGIDVEFFKRVKCFCIYA